MSHKTIRLMGDGTIGGGTYDSIRIVGNGQVVDQVEATTIRVLGNGDFKEVKAGDIGISGNAYFDGDIESESLKVSGTVRIRGTVRNKKMAVNGELKAVAIETEGLVSHGKLEVNTIKATDVQITPFGRSEVKEIKADSIDVSNKGLWGKVQILVGSRFKELKADIIEGDSITLERTKAKIVKGNKIKIGPECNIGTVEFRDSLNVSKDSTVEQTVQF